MKYPQRIVSLVPSQTELLYDLGLGARVVGITKFCTEPNQWFRTKTRIGGTKTVHIEQVLALKPDLILANKEENDREQVQQLEQYCPVWTSDIKNLSDALRMIEHIGELTGTASRAKEISQEIATKMEVLIPPAHPLQKAVYLIWRKPYMTVGGDTFIHDMLQYAGFSNAFKHLSRYPECAASDLPEAAPDYILLSSEPFPFQQKHLRELEEICPNAKVILVDGAFFSWYGSRLLRAATYFGGLLG